VLCFCHRKAQPAAAVAPARADPPCSATAKPSPLLLLLHGVNTQPATPSSPNLPLLPSPCCLLARASVLLTPSKSAVPSLTCRPEENKKLLQKMKKEKKEV
jgi:hypothetical protein